MYDKIGPTSPSPLFANEIFPMSEPQLSSSITPAPSTDDGITFRPMTADDLQATQAMSDALRWPHRPADWEQAFAHAEGVVAERAGRIVATAQRWLWGERHATVGLVIVSPDHQGHGLGRRLMQAMLEGLDGRSVLLQATNEGRGLYERLGFVATGSLRQHQGEAKPTALIGLPPGWRLRPVGANDTAALQRLDAASRGMPRDALIKDLLAVADACVVLDHESEPRGFAMLRRFGRGHVIGPVVAPDAESAKVLIAHLVGQNAGRFTRIDVDHASGLSEWLEGIGLPVVDAPTTMLRGAPLATAAQGPTLFAITTQALC